MEYSLNHLNLISNLKELTVSEFINSLNLIGLEVDEISKKKMKLNSSVENIKIVLKIPANREDLLIEDFFLDEISTIFSIERVNHWENLKKKYNFLLKQKYLQYSNYRIVTIASQLPSIVTYAIQLEKFQNLSAPLWIRNKLNNFGIESQNNFNDILNLVIAEWGQSVNAFPISTDYCSTYSVVRLEKKEIFMDLNQKTLEVLPGTIVLKEENCIVSILGVINLWSDKTNQKNVIFESTFYDMEENPLNIHVMNPKVSFKYLRKMLLEKTKYAFQRVLTLVEILGYASSVLPIKYCTPKQKKIISPSKILRLKKQSLRNILGIQEINETIFQQAGLKIICKTKNDLYFKIPNSRKDITREIDLIEEYSRFFGFKNFPEFSPTSQISNSFSSNESNLFLKQIFLNNGFYEIVTNSLTEYSNKNSSSISLTNPLNNELSCLRKTLIPKLVEVFATNLRLSSNVTNFFEIGRVFNQFNEQIIEENKVAGIFQIPKLPGSKEQDLDWFSALGFFENILLQFGYSSVQKEQFISDYSFSHPKRSILFIFNNKRLGYFGQISPKDPNYSTLRKPTYFFELNLTHFKTFNLYSIPLVSKEYSKYPKITKDISFSCSKTINFNDIKKSLKQNISHLKSISFFDIYFDKRTPDLINLGIRFEFQSLFGTLTNETIDIELAKTKSVLIEMFLGKINE